MEKLLPLAGFILVKPITQDTSDFRFASGNADTQVDGEVVAVGEPKENEFGIICTTEVKPGDKIVHRAYGKENYKYGGIDYRLVKFNDCVAILK